MQYFYVWEEMTTINMPKTYISASAATLTEYISEPHEILFNTVNVLICSRLSRI